MSEPEGRSRPATVLLVVAWVMVCAAWAYSAGTSRTPISQLAPTTSEVGTSVIVVPMTVAPPVIVPAPGEGQS